jgi:hypothetical protein
MIDLQACLDYQKQVSKDRTSSTVDMDLAGLAVDVALLAQKQELPEDLLTSLQLLINHRDDEKAEIAKLHQSLKAAGEMLNRALDEKAAVQMELDELQRQPAALVMPVGWEAGRPLPLSDALAGMAMEMLSHRSDLQHQADRRQAGPAAEDLRRLADELERYAVVIQVLSLQLTPERWQASAMAGLMELAQKHHLALPDWMTAEK